MRSAAKYVSAPIARPTASSSAAVAETPRSRRVLRNKLKKAGFTDVITHWPRAEGVYSGSEDVLIEVASRFAR